MEWLWAVPCGEFPRDLSIWEACCWRSSPFYTSLEPDGRHLVPVSCKLSGEEDRTIGEVDVRDEGIIASGSEASRHLPPTVGIRKALPGMAVTPTYVVGR